MDYETLPEEYRPAWYRAGLTPLSVNSEMKPTEVKDKMKKQKTDPYAKKSAPIIFLKDGEEMPKIREALTMQAPEASMWYEDLNSSVPEDQIVDNNDFVDLEKVQIPAPPSIASIRQKLLKKQEQVKPAKPMFAAPGEYVLFYNKEIVEVGTLQKIKPFIEEIIINNEELTDDDLAVFLRVPLDKIFK